MIRLPAGPHSSTQEAFGLRLLVDASRVVPAAGSVTGVTTLEIGADRTFDVTVGGDPFETIPGIVRVPRNVLTQVAALAGATAEQGSTRRDRFGRVPSADNPLVMAGAERRPVLSELAMTFRNAVIRAAGGGPFRAVAPWPDGHRWAAVLTHDLDVVSGWPIFTALRLVELLRKGELGRMARVIGAAAVAGRDPVTAGIATLLKTEADLGVRSSWFILTGTPTLQTWRQGDLTYRPESHRARGILDRIRSGGHELGLHGSFVTMDRPEAFADQRDRLAALIGQPPTGARQHFLRMRPMATQQQMAQAGFRYDSTFGFADRNGFRLGLADVVPMPDLPELDLLPFCWMDRALSKYQGVEDPAAWVRDGLDLARTCQRVGGVWCGIWHPNLVPALGFPGGAEAYSTLVRGLQSIDAPWIALATDVVEWRRARRSVEVVRVEDGDVFAAVGYPSAQSLWLEDGEGTRRERVGVVA